jgi:HK97 gp10 family phage protein
VGDDMGKFDFNFDSDLTQQLERLENFDEIAQKVLGGATPILERHVKAETEKHKKSGDLYTSIKPSKPKKNQYGWYSTVKPTGKDKKGVRNMEKMAYLEYGTSNEDAHPVLTKALKDAEPEVTEKMQEIYNEAVKE